MNATAKLIQLDLCSVDNNKDVSFPLPPGEYIETVSLDGHVSTALIRVESNRCFEAYYLGKSLVVDLYLEGNTIGVDRLAARSEYYLTPCVSMQLASMFTAALRDDVEAQKEPCLVQFESRNQNSDQSSELSV